MEKNAKLSKSEIAYKEIRRAITEFILMPGQIICIKHLSDYLSFSTTPLREALFGLEKDGYIARNRTNHFYVTQIDGNHIRHLFEYGKILYTNYVGYCRLDNSFYQFKSTIIPPSDHTKTFNIDYLYQYVQIHTKNEFVSGQMNIFRIKSDSIRTALINSNKELYFNIYGSLYSTDNFDMSFSQIFEEIYLLKNEFADVVANSIMSYYINKKLSCDIKYNNSIRNVL